MINRLRDKIRTAYRLLRRGLLGEFFEVLVRPFVRVYSHRLDCLDVADYHPHSSSDGPRLRMSVASPAEMQRLFDEWPDSREEYERHHDVYYAYGFKRCLLFYVDDDPRPAHFQFLLTSEDRPAARNVIPRQVCKLIEDPTAGSIEWVYTFEGFRRRGITLVATNHIVAYCRDHGIKTLYSRRGLTNAPSIKMADRIGFRPIAVARQVQFLRQTRQQGFYVLTRYPAER